MTSYDLLCRGMLYARLAAKKLEEETNAQRLKSIQLNNVENYVELRFALVEVQCAIKALGEAAAATRCSNLEALNLPTDT